ncbi:MAG: stage II sporulation protein D [Evtepia sp.]
MKKIAGVGLLLALVLFLIPLGLRQQARQGEENQAGQATLPDSGHTLSILVDGQVQEMDLEQYIWGVVAAEMPASFEEEALKAQAVAARTYSLNKAGGSPNHPEADLCTDYHCCQAWISREAAEANWGESAGVYADKITHAVADTAGQVVLYEGQLIDAVFHSSSDQATLDAVEVWGGSVPYLQSVSSPEGEEVPNFHSEVSFTAQEFRDLFLAARPEAVLEGAPETWFGETVRTAGGSVHTIQIGGVSVTGTQVRQILSLRSACFTVSCTEDSVTFSVTGFGHGVGMSQYGANAMASAGSTYTEILEHYYTGVTVEACPDTIWAELS